MTWNPEGKKPDRSNYIKENAWTIRNIHRKKTKDKKQNILHRYKGLAGHWGENELRTLKHTEPHSEF